MAKSKSKRPATPEHLVILDELNQAQSDPKHQALLERFKNAIPAGPDNSLREYEGLHLDMPSREIELTVEIAGHPLALIAQCQGLYINWQFKYELKTQQTNHSRILRELLIAHYQDRIYYACLVEYMEQVITDYETFQRGNDIPDF